MRKFFNNNAKTFYYKETELAKKNNFFEQIIMKQIFLD